VFPVGRRRRARRGLCTLARAGPTRTHERVGRGGGRRNGGGRRLKGAAVGGVGRERRQRWRVQGGGLEPRRVQRRGCGRSVCGGVRKGPPRLGWQGFSLGVLSVAYKK
jgi:hypothetical protein